MVLDQGNPEAPENRTEAGGSAPKRLPRETGEDIGLGSPVPLSKEAVQIITKLRNMKVSFEPNSEPNFTDDLTG
jgi:hypothetical protein